MQAIVYYEYGGPEVLRLEEIEKPSPGDDDVLVKVHAASVNPYDVHFMRGTPFPVRLAGGLSKPKAPRLGADVAGVVEAAGKSVTEFKPGDKVFGAARGSFAECAVGPARVLTVKPPSVSFEEAASLPIAAITALQGLHTGQVQSGRKVLINGAAGGVGTFAVQIAKSFGAYVTGVCSSRNVDLVQSLGAECVVDYTKEDFTASGRRYDLIFDCVGNRALSDIRRALTRDGMYLVVGGPDGRWLGPLIPMIKAMLLSPFVSQKLSPVFAKMVKTDLATLGDMMTTEKIKAVIDRRYSLKETPEAMRYVEQGHARGKVIITVA